MFHNPLKQQSNMGNSATQPAATAAAQQQATGTQLQPVSADATALKALQKDISDGVLARVTTLEQAGELRLPEGYTAGNAIKLAWLYLQTVVDRNQRPALDVCTKDSICNCFLEMVIKGLSVAKKQCYFIVAGNQLTFWEDYRGKYMRAKRDTEIKDVFAQVVYKGDNFVYTVDEFGQYQLVSHETKMENINLQNITGAYAVVVNKDGSRHLELMTIDQIRNSWQQGAAKGNSMAHTKFTDQMCKKTVISRACKIALGAAVEEADEPDTAAQERKQAQADATQFEMVDAQEVVDVETGEVVPALAAPAPADAQPAGTDLFGDQPEQGKTRKCPL